MPRAVTTIIVCDTCRYTVEEKTSLDGLTGGEVLAGEIERLAAAREGVEVRRHSCLLGCERHCNAAIVAEGKVSYVLGNFAPGAEAAHALVDYASLHHESATGQVPFRQWPSGVKGHFVARVPAFPAAPAAPELGD